MNMEREITETLQRMYDEHYSQNHLKESFRGQPRSNLQSFARRIVGFCSRLKKYPQGRRVYLLYLLITLLFSYEYDSDSDSKYCFLQALIKGKAVCNGIAELFHILCFGSRVDSQIVIGYASEGYHAWVQVKIREGNTTEWYMLDPTWDLGKNQDEWRYFMKSDDYFNKNGHLWLADKCYACPKNWDRIPELSGRGVKLLCRVFQKELLLDY